MRCQHCDYLLFNLTHPVCPECGREFDLETYRFEPGAVSFNCPHCDQEYYGNDAYGLPWPRAFTCVNCQHPVTLQQLRVVPKHPEAMGMPRDQSPWDRRRRLGLLTAWWETFTMTLVRPGMFFRQHSGRSIKEAWLFSMITLYIGGLGYFVYQMLAMWSIGALITAVTLPGGGPPPPGPPLAVLAIMYGVMGLTFPLFVQFVGGAFWACTIQLALLALAPRRKPIGYTFRTALYSFGPYALYVIPFCGATIGGVWQLVTLIIGVKEVHGISGWRASIAVLWPIVVLFGLYIVGIVVFLFYLAGSAQGGS